RRVLRVQFISLPLIALLVVVLNDRGFVIAAAAAVEGKRHEAAADHQSERHADAQERVAPVRQLDAAGMRGPTLIGDPCGTPEQQDQHDDRNPAAGHRVLLRMTPYEAMGPAPKDGYGSISLSSAGFAAVAAS